MRTRGRESGGQRRSVHRRQGCSGGSPERAVRAQNRWAGGGKSDSVVGERSRRIEAGLDSDGAPRLSGFEDAEADFEHVERLGAGAVLDGAVRQTGPIGFFVRPPSAWRREPDAGRRSDCRSDAKARAAGW
jgi:hypothetical protein